MKTSLKRAALFLAFLLLGPLAGMGASVATAIPVRIEVTLVDGGAYSGGTFQSNNQKVVQNKRGIFTTHNSRHNEDFTAQLWRLSWSRDGGKTFTTLHEATDATNPPVLETDAADNIYVMQGEDSARARKSPTSHRLLR